MSRKIFVICSLMGLLWVKGTYSQNLDENLLAKIEQLKADLPQLLQKYPNNPILRYIQGFLETDGEKAVEIYKDLIDKYPNSSCADDAQLKIGQYYFAKGLYITARKTLRELVDKYPDSPYCDDSQYLIARCLYAAGEVASARMELEQFVRDHPTSPLAEVAVQELRDMESSQSEEMGGDKISENKSAVGFALQIGAYRDKNNAINQQKDFQEKGYSVEIQKKGVTGEVLYLVWLGNFRDEKGALDFGKSFRKRFGLPFRVVKRNQ